MTVRASLLSALALLSAGLACARPVTIAERPLDLGTVQPPTDRPAPSEVTTPRHTVAQVATTCVSSWYGAELAGATMANGAPFDPDRATAASWDVPLGARLAVTNPATGATVEVVVTDRGPRRSLGRCLDLSRSAFEQIADPNVGLVDVVIVEVG
jgi:rare lipoprotein A (peptidoglycan hydrolase)